VGENVLDFSDWAPITIAKNNDIALIKKKKIKTKWQTLREWILFVVSAVFIKNQCVQFANVSRNGVCYSNGEFYWCKRPYI